MGSDNNLYFLAADRTMNAFRAYFQLNLDASSEVKAFVLNFGDEIVDGINSLTFGENEMVNDKSSNGKWYDLSGRKLSGQPSKGGIYIVNGKKVLY